MSCYNEPNIQQTLLTLCWLDGPLIKYTQFLDVLRESSSSLLTGISQNKSLWEAEKCRSYKCIQFHSASYVQHTFPLLCSIFLYSLPTGNNFSSLCILKPPRESAWQELFRPPWCCLLLWQLKFIRTWLNCILDFWYPRQSYHVQEALVLYFFVGVLCLVHKKMHWRVHSLADTTPPFSTTFFDYMTVFLRNE